MTGWCQCSGTRTHAALIVHREEFEMKKSERMRTMDYAKVGLLAVVATFELSMLLLLLLLLLLLCCPVVLGLFLDSHRR